MAQSDQSQLTGRFQMNWSTIILVALFMFVFSAFALLSIISWLVALPANAFEAIIPVAPLVFIVAMLYAIKYQFQQDVEWITSEVNRALHN